jgi:hypothetical protein
MLPRRLPTGFIAPCLPTKTDKLPSGGLWLHEIKLDGFLTARTPRRLGYRHRCVAYLADIARAE